MRILVVDDERKIRDVIKSYLIREGFEVGEADNGTTALAMAQNQGWDLIVLDLMMPSVDGMQVIRELRKGYPVPPVIILTARSDEVDRVLGLELGADDYVVKPFSPRELVARVKAVLRRANADKDPTASPELIHHQGLSIDHSTRQVLVDNQPVELTPKEFDLLLYLARSPKRIFRRNELLDQVWGFDYFGDTRTVDTTINRLRDKLGKVTDTNYIKTVWGIGYGFGADHDDH